MSGIGVAFGFGFFYFLAAIPAGTAAGLPTWGAAIVAWAGYSSGAGVVILIGAPFREWIVRRFGFSLERDSSKWIWRVWDHWGLKGLGIIAPVTVGPQIGSILALSLGEKSISTFLSLSLGVVPWCILFTILVEAGVKLVH